MRIRLWLTEGAELRALCLDPAELLTALGKAGIPVSDFSDLGESRYAFWVEAARSGEVIRLGEKLGAEITLLRRRGGRHFLRRFRRRLWLLLIPLPLLLAFGLLSTRIWEIDVTGNVTVTRGEILAALEELGVYPGASGLRLDNPKIRSCMQAAVPELIWCTVQVHGSRAVVEVRERREKPEIVDEALVREVAARRSGTIQQLNVLQGKAAVARGDTVEPGQLLISGLLLDRQEEGRFVHAQGRVWAVTWYEERAVLPLGVWEKRHTGAEKTRYALKIGDLRLNFYRDGSISWTAYDKITEEKRLQLFGLALPLCLVREEVREYEPVWWELPASEAADLAGERLEERLRSENPEAEMLELSLETETGEDTVCVRLLAQCREDIALERELSP